MKSFDARMNEYIQRYFAYKGKHLTLEEIAKRPHWKRVWYYRLAMEKYEGAKISNLSIEDVKNIYGD